MHIPGFYAPLVLEPTGHYSFDYLRFPVRSHGQEIYVRNSRPPAAASEIFVIGKQWMWHLQHSEGPREIDELHVPVGVPIKLTMTSQDVIHRLLYSGLSREEGCAAQPLQLHLVSGERNRHLTSLLRPVLWHQSLRHDRVEKSM